METWLSKRTESNRYRRGDKLAAGNTTRVPVRGAPSKSAQRSCSCILWDASRYFVDPKEPAHTVQPKSGLLRKVLKFGHAFSGRRGERRVQAGSEQGRKKLRVDGEECCRRETEKEGEWRKEERGKKLCHRPRWVILSIARASVGKADEEWGWVFTVRLSSCRRHPYVSPFYGILSFIDAEQPTPILPSALREWRARAGQTAKFDRWHRRFVTLPLLFQDSFLFTNSKINNLNNNCKHYTK